MTKKYNQKNIIKKIKSFISKNDIKPEIAGVYINKERGVIVTTDGFKLVELSYITNIETGIYNLDTLQKIEGVYPDYQKIMYTIDESVIVEITTIDKLHTYITTCATQNIKGINATLYFDKNFDKNHFIDAIELFQAMLAVDITITYKEGKPLTLKSGQCTILIMPLNI